MRFRDNLKAYQKKLAVWKSYFAQLKDACEKSKSEIKRSKITKSKKRSIKISKGNK